MTPTEELEELAKLCPPGRRPISYVRSLVADCEHKRDSVVRNIKLRMEAEQQAAAYRRLLRVIVRHVNRFGSLSNHGHRHEGTACAECQILNAAEEALK